MSNETQNGLVVIRVNASALMPDNAQWTNRMSIRSESSDRMYTVSQNKSGKFWGCSCMGWIRHKNCKHLRALGLPAYMKPMNATLKGGF